MLTTGGTGPAQRDVTPEATLVNGSPVEVTLQSDGNVAGGFIVDGLNHKAIIDRSEDQAYLLCRGRELPIEIETHRDRLLRKATRGAGAGITHTEIKAAMPMERTCSRCFGSAMPP